MTIFRAYDVRGVYPDVLNEEMAEGIGAAFVAWLGKDSPAIAVGIDARTSGPAIKEALVKGLVSAGARVTDVGMVPTPVIYFATASYKLDGGIMITASHNPPEYNGFKFCKAGGVALSYEDGLEAIERILKRGDFPRGKGSVEEKDTSSDYMAFVMKNVGAVNPVKVVIDAGNGCAGLLASRLFKAAGCDVVELYCQPDGNFPNHQPNPLNEETLEDLKKKVTEEGADLGVAFDGDGDRLGIVDEKGCTVPNYKIFGMFIKDALRKKPGAKILYDVVVSKAVEDIIKSAGGVPVVSRVGHSYIQDNLLREGCAIAGENSGHFYFSESFGYDDGLFAGLKVIKLIEGNSMSESVRGFPEYVSSKEYRPHCSDTEKFGLVKKLKEELKRFYRVVDLDGVRVEFDKGWFIVRASNTAPQLMVRWEAEDEKEFERIGAFVHDKLARLGIKIEI